MELNEKYVGKKFGHLTIIDVWRDKEKKETMCRCMCDCGNTHISYVGKVTSGKIASCGCQKGNKKHNAHGSRLYRIWQAMKSRCLNPNTANYKYYGGRGINVCDEWMEFAPFAEWAKEHGYSDNLTIDRKDIDKGYCPDNCEWVTMKHQNNHHKSNIYQIEIDGEKYSLRDFVDLIGESYSKIQTRLNRGKITVESLKQKYCGGLTLNQYQEKAMSTCMPTCENPLYMVGLIQEEAGELQGKINKAIRKGLLEFVNNQMVWLGTPEELEDFHAEMQKELGDILWAVAGTANVFRWDMNGTGQTNLDKLASRQKRGVIDGAGDNR